MNLETIVGKMDEIMQKSRVLALAVLPFDSFFHPLDREWNVKMNAKMFIFNAVECDQNICEFDKMRSETTISPVKF